MSTLPVTAPVDATQQCLTPLVSTPPVTAPVNAAQQDLIPHDVWGNAVLSFLEFSDVAPVLLSGALPDYTEGVFGDLVAERVEPELTSLCCKVVQQGPLSLTPDQAQTEQVFYRHVLGIEGAEAVALIKQGRFDDALVTAASSEDARCFKAILEAENRGLRVSGEAVEKAFLVAAKAGRLGVLQALWDTMDKECITSEDLDIGIVEAARAGHEEVVSYILHRDWCYGQNYTTNGVEEALEAAVVEGHTPVVQSLLGYILRHGLYIMSPAVDSCYVAAAARGQLDNIQLLLEMTWPSGQGMSRQGLEDAIEAALQGSHWNAARVLLRTRVGGGVSLAKKVRFLCRLALAGVNQAASFAAAHPVATASVAVGLAAVAYQSLWRGGVSEETLT